MMTTSLVTVACLGLVASAASQAVFLSEIHYDNSGGDQGEAVEVTGPAGTRLNMWSIALHNGKGGAVYETIPLSGTIPNQANGYGSLAFYEKGIQNGPNGLALIDDKNEVQQYLSYGGRFKASNGAAEGMTSVDIGVSESRRTATGVSLQLVGSGSAYRDFEWISGVKESFGQINTGMSIIGECSAEGTGPGCVAPPAEEAPDTTQTDAGEGSSIPTPLNEPEVAVDTSGAPCMRTPVKIGSIQGSGESAVAADQTVTVRGIVTAVFPRLSGFYVQDAGDGVASTSDGVFINVGSSPIVQVGDEVAVSGLVSDNYANTQIAVQAVSDMDVCSSGNPLPEPVKVTLPTDPTTLESLEGMLCSIVRPVVTDNYNSGKYGEITVAGERLWQFTQVNKPSKKPLIPEGTSLIIDDGASGQFPDPDVYVDQASAIRVGQTLEDVEGVIAEGFGTYRLQPTSTKLFVMDNKTNARPTNIPEGGGNVRVASFNVLNYFTTLNERGAKTEQQRQDQLAKITQGALALNADVIAIVEVENDYDKLYPSIQVIVDSINEKDVGAAWRYVVPSTSPLGTDMIAVGIIYDSNKVAVKGPSDVLDYGDSKTRASLAQTLSVKCGKDIEQCPAFTLVVNHLKSKGSSCDSIGDPDMGDGQGNCNQTRTKAIRTLINWLKGSSINVSPDPDILLAGDFNSYAMEDPIQEAAKAGFEDLSASDPEFPRVSSYVFSGESGTLDYILATSSAVAQRVGNLKHYPINADETAALEYDNCGTNDACIVSLDQYRCSDHDMAAQDFQFV